MQMKINYTHARNGTRVGGGLAARLVRWCGVAGLPVYYWKHKAPNMLTIYIDPSKQKSWLRPWANPI
jgi:hypothetical protein